MFLRHQSHISSATASPQTCLKPFKLLSLHHGCRRTVDTRCAMTFTGPDGSSRTFVQEIVTVGSKSSADLQVTGNNIAEEHAEVFQKGGRTYCRAMAGDEEDLTSSSYAWLNESESSLRTGVAYLLAPDTYLAFGEAENKYQIAFEEKSSGGTAMFESLMKGMAAVANADVQKQMKDMLG